MIVDRVHPAILVKKHNSCSHTRIDSCANVVSKIVKQHQDSSGLLGLGRSSTSHTLQRLWNNFEKTNPLFQKEHGIKLSKFHADIGNDAEGCKNLAYLLDIPFIYSSTSCEGCTGTMQRSVCLIGTPKPPALLQILYLINIINLTPTEPVACGSSAYIRIFFREILSSKRLGGTKTPFLWCYA